MYHGRFSKSHYEAGYNWGSLLYKNGKNIDQSPAFRLTGERRMFAENRSEEHTSELQSQR